MRTAILLLAALGCAPVTGVVDPTDDPGMTQEDPYTWSGVYLPMALDRIRVQGRAETSPRCVQLVLVYPGWDRPEWSVEVDSGWGLESAWVREDACPEEPTWPDDAESVDDVSGQISLTGDWPPDVTLDVLVSTPLSTSPIPIDVTVEVGG